MTGMEFVLVKGGCYQMGDVFGDGEQQESPVHEVCVTDFYLGAHEVTQGQWQKVMGTNPSAYKECGPNCPVDNVRWEMAQEFIRTLNGKSGRQYRLPTEAEWEYAARSGGMKEKWAGTSDEDKLGEFAWFDKNSEGKRHPVGLKKPNALGLYDMSRNVMEWCRDWYDEAFYKASSRDNPAGPATGGKRVIRGGAHDYSSVDLRASARHSDDLEVFDVRNGLRLLLPATKQ